MLPPPLKLGSGSGSGSGDGDGSGYGSGDGSGDGSGYGDGDGQGYIMIEIAPHLMGMLNSYEIRAAYWVQCLMCGRGLTKLGWQGYFNEYKPHKPCQSSNKGEKMKDDMKYERPDIIWAGEHVWYEENEYMECAKYHNTVKLIEELKRMKLGLDVCGSVTTITEMAIYDAAIDEVIKKLNSL